MFKSKDESSPMNRDNIALYISTIAEEFEVVTPQAPEVREERKQPQNQEKATFNILDCVKDVLTSQPGTLNREASTSSSTSETTYCGKLVTEMECYEGLTIIPQEASPYEWWSQNASRFPILSTMAKKYLSSPPSSVESERIFSLGTQIYSPKRNRISAISAERLMFINYNLRMCNYKYTYKFSNWKLKTK